MEIAFRVHSSPANSAYPLTVEFFVSDGGGEGATFIVSTVYTAANFAAGVKTVSFAGAGTGLSAGVSKIVGLATDLNGNTSEFSTQHTVVAGGARFSAAAQQSLSSLDVNVDGVVSRADAVSLISFINSSGAIDGNFRIRSSEPTALRYDTSGDGVVSSLDLLLVVRGLQKSNLANQAVPSVQQLADTDFWDSVLRDLDVEDLIEIKPALTKSRWL